MPQPGGSGGKREKDKNQNVQVAVRVRPMSEQEKKEGIVIVTPNPDSKVVEVKEKSHCLTGTRAFPPFDKVYGPKSTQLEIYKEIVKPQLEEILKGYNCTIFAYGQTGTGKTFTMEGDRSDDPSVTWESDPLSGIIPRTLHHLFDKLEADPETEFSVRVSFVELYNEQLYDLLGGNQMEKLNLYEDTVRKGSVILTGNEEKVVRNKQEVYHILRQGAEKRKTAATLLNATSSRSHSVFTITVHLRENTLDGQELLKIGKMNLVDLAGSENIGRSGAMDKRAREAGNINQSLLTLGRVITALVERQPHIPYRESKLTRLLQDSLGGKTITTLIATISPCSSNYEETISTLDYATRAKNIKNHPEVNQKLTRKGLIKGYMEEIDKLRRDLLAAREKNGVYLAEENYQEMEMKITRQEQCIEEYEGRIQAMEGELMKKMEEFAMMDEKHRRALKKLQSTKTRLSERRKQLKDTTYNLAVAERELEMKEMLIQNHKKREMEILDQASKVLTVAESATQDVKGLHDKVQRQLTTQERNLAYVKEYNALVQEAIETGKLNLEQTDVRLKEGIREQLTGFDSVQTVRHEGVENLLRMMKDLEESVRARTEEFISRGDAALDEDNTRAESFATLASDYKVSLLSDVNNLLSAMRSKTRELKEGLESAENQIELHRETLKTQEERHRLHMREHISKLMSVWDEAQQKSESHCKEQEEKIIRAEEKLAALKESDAKASF